MCVRSKYQSIRERDIIFEGEGDVVISPVFFLRELYCCWCAAQYKTEVDLLRLEVARLKQCGATARYQQEENGTSGRSAHIFFMFEKSLSLSRCVFFP
jgi:hypothetical protein